MTAGTIIAVIKETEGFLTEKDLLVKKKYYLELKVHQDMYMATVLQLVISSPGEERWNLLSVTMVRKTMINREMLSGLRLYFRTDKNFLRAKLYRSKGENVGGVSSPFLEIISKD